MNTGWKKNIVLFLSSQSISLLGSSLVQFAISWHITLETQSGLMMTLSIICGFLPVFLVSPLAGVWADRYEKRVLIAVSDGFIALTTLALAVLFFMGHRSITLLFIASALRGIGQGIQQPSVGAILPRLVPEEALMKVNAANGSIQSLLMLVSPMLAGALMTFFPLEVIFFIDVITAAAAIFIMLAFVRQREGAPSSPPEKSGFFRELREGFIYIAGHGFIKRLFIYCAVFFVMAGPVALLSPLQVTRTFGGDTWRLTAIEVVFSVGMLLGGLLLMAWGGFKNRHHSITVAYFAFAACTMLLGLVPFFWLYLVVMGLTGLSMPLFNTPFSVLLQEKVEPDFLGRVFGVLTMLSSLGMPLGILVFGPMADAVRLEWIFVGTGVVMAVTSAFMCFDRPLLKAGAPPEALREG